MQVTATYSDRLHIRLTRFLIFVACVAIPAYGPWTHGATYGINNIWELMLQHVFTSAGNCHSNIAPSAQSCRISRVVNW